MFKLYFNYNGWEKVGIYYNEKDVIKDMKIITNKYKRYYFMVIERIDNCDSIITATRTEEDLNEYIAEVNDRYNRKQIDDMSCLELKDYITRKTLKRKK